MIQVRGTTRIYAVIGHPVAHSISPEMQNAAMEALGMDGCYIAFDVPSDKLAGAIEAIRALNIGGVNVTIPHKKAVIPLLDSVSEEARVVGAVNTIRNVDGVLTGFNTDVDGFIRAVRSVTGWSELPEKAIIFGAGGAARAVAYALGREQSVREVVILNRTVERAEALAHDMVKISAKKFSWGGLTPDSLRRELSEGKFLINTTSLGMFPDVEGSPIEDESLIPEGIFLYDCVYNPPKTRLMEMVRRRGGRASSGLDMLVFQGARALEIWTGLVPPVDVMREALKKNLGIKSAT